MHTLPDTEADVKTEQIYMLIHDKTNRPVVGFYDYATALRQVRPGYHVEKLEMCVTTVKGIRK